MKLFIVGVNGISMRGIAKIMQEQNNEVLGFDDTPNKIEGIKYTTNIPKDTDILVYSSAIKENHPLIIKAKEKKIPIISRTDFFIKYMPLNTKKILIAGAHGKTTTAAIIAYLLDNASYYLGGIIENEESSSKFQKEAEYTIIETDESDGSFINWKGEYKILLNFDYEHMIYYKTKENIMNYYYKFVMNDIEKTKIIILKKAKELLNIPDHPNIITYGESKADYVYSKITANEKGISFRINKIPMQIALLGEHNAYNFTAVFALFKLIKKSINKMKDFPGVKKRMQKIKYPNHELDFFLDYGHHPEEIKSVLNSLKKHFKNKKFDIIFEPHKPSRILDNLEKWPEIFKDYKIFLAELFVADEKEINEKELKFSTQKFFEYLKNKQIDVTLIKENLINLPLNQKPLICFSAGNLSEELQKFKTNS